MKGGGGISKHLACHDLCLENSIDYDNTSFNGRHQIIAVSEESNRKHSLRQEGKLK